MKKKHIIAAAAFLALVIAFLAIQPLHVFFSASVKTIENEEVICLKVTNLGFPIYSYRVDRVERKNSNSVKTWEAYEYKPDVMFEYSFPAVRPFRTRPEYYTASLFAEPLEKGEYRFVLTEYLYDNWDNPKTQFVCFEVK